MRILVVAATTFEIAPLVAGLQPAIATTPTPRVHSYQRYRHELHVLVTGVGMVATATWVSRTLERAAAEHRPYGMVFNFGVCGAFEPVLAPGTVVHIVEDRFAELGAEDGESFLTLEDLQLVGEHDLPPLLAEPQTTPPNPALDALPRVSGITVNTVHGCDRSIAEVVRRFHPQVESMEGAAFMYACSTHGVAHAQVRAVSNLVEKRNRAAWKLPEAIGQLGAAARDIVSQA